MRALVIIATLIASAGAARAQVWSTPYQWSTWQHYAFWYSHSYNWGRPVPQQYLNLYVPPCYGRFGCYR